MEVADVAEVGIDPLQHVVVELLEISDGLFLLIQPLSSFAKLFGLQFNYLPGIEDGEHNVVTDGSLDLVEALLEATESVNSNVQAICAGALELVHPLSLLVEDMAVRNTKNLGAGVAVLVATLVEEEPDALLRRP